MTLRPCTRCGRDAVRPVEAIAEDLARAPGEARANGESHGMRWVMLECAARRIADEIRGVCVACHLSGSHLGSNQVGNTKKEKPC